MGSPGGKWCLDVEVCSGGCDIGGGTDRLGEDMTAREDEEPVRYGEPGEAALARVMLMGFSLLPPFPPRKI